MKETYNPTYSSEDHTNRNVPTDFDLGFSTEGAKGYRSEFDELTGEIQEYSELLALTINALETKGHLDIEAFSDREKSLFHHSSYSKEWLIESAEWHIAHEKRGEALAFLSGRTPNGGIGVFERDANSIAIAIKRLSGAREEPREELQAEAINFAQEVYDPSQAQRDLSAEHVNPIAESISYDDMSKFIGEDIDRILETKDLSNIVSILEGLSLLFNKYLETNVSVELGDVEEDDSGGHYDPFSRKVTIASKSLNQRITHTKTILKEGNKDASNLVPIILVYLGETVSHEYFHAYQHNYEDENDDDRALKYALNFASYIKGADRPEEYKRQLIEREAIAFGVAFRKKLLQFIIDRLYVGYQPLAS